MRLDEKAKFIRRTTELKIRRNSEISYKNRKTSQKLFYLIYLHALFWELCDPEEQAKKNSKYWPIS